MLKIQMTRNAKISLLTVGTVIALAGVVWAAFSDQGKILGTTFSTASADLKLLQNLGGGTDETNLKDELPGPIFDNISPTWKGAYFLKLYNNGSTYLNIVSNANYATANDPDDLRNYIDVEFFEWTDANNNSAIDEGELSVSLGKKSIVKWKTEGFDLGILDPAQTTAYYLEFTSESLPSTKQGKSGIYDFEFDAIETSAL